MAMCRRGIEALHLKEDPEEFRVLEAPHITAGLDDVADRAIALKARTALHFSKATAIASAVWKGWLGPHVSGRKLARVLVLVTLSVQDG